MYLALSAKAEETVQTTIPSVNHSEGTYEHVLAARRLKAQTHSPMP